MDAKRFSETLEQTIQFFEFYRDEHIARIDRFQYARAITRDISAEVTGIELKIIQERLERLKSLRAVSAPGDEDLRCIAEYLNEAKECLDLQRRNVDFATQAIPVRAHKVGQEKAIALQSALKALKDHPELAQFSDSHTVTWHTQRHHRGIDFTALVIVPYLFASPNLAQAALSQLQQAIRDHQSSTHTVHPIAAADTFYAYPRSFMPTFEALSGDAAGYGKQQVLDALAIVEKDIPQPAQREARHAPQATLIKAS